MKIAIDTIPLLSTLTGVGNYAYQISKSLRRIDRVNEYTYYYGYYSQQLILLAERKETFHWIDGTLRKIPLLRTAARNLKNSLNYFSFRKFDLYFEPNFIPLSIPAQHIVATVLDFSFARFPEWHPPDRVRYFKKHFWEKIKKAERVIVISDFIKNEATNHFGFSEDQLTTIHLGIDADIFKVYPPENLISIRNQYHLPQNFILFVGSIEPRKNLKNLLRAYVDLDETIRKEFKIVLVGFKGWENDEILAMIRKLKSDVFYIGYVPEGELGKFYNLARLFVYPSFYEGFGLPPLEAMACGCPVVVSSVASLPEVCGDGVYYIDPENIGSIIMGIKKVLNDETLRKSLILRGLERSKLFSWEKSAREHLKVFEEIC